ncbi:MAG TPA: hypothetical protein VKC53_01620 [Patescibacteria group bacterium]|nr:hypothetical protein [Patescibacteria group bacterium]
MKTLNRILTKYSNWFLIAFFVAALILRWWYLPQKAISFAYDQARDAFVVQDLLRGNLKILGPPVSGVPGLFHGVLYYYVIAPAYLFGHGNPVVVAYFLSFVSSLGVFVVFFLTKLLTKNKIPALIASLIFAFSFEATQYANFLINASMAVWFVPVFYVGLYLWITKSNKWAPIIAGLGLGLSIQSEVALSYHIFPLIIWLLVFKDKIVKKDLIIFILSFMIGISSMILAEIKFGLTGTSGILYLLTGQDGIVQTKTLSDYIVTLINQSGKVFAYSLYPKNIVFGGLLGFTMIISSIFLNLNEIKNKILTWETFLTVWIFAYSVALPFGGWNMKHILVGVAPAICIFAGIFIWKYFSNYKFILSIALIIVLFANLSTILKENKNGQTIFPLQPDLILRNETSLVDYTYQRSGNEPFSISSLTSPLFVNTLWSYLYNWYGQSKYGYLPSWIGRDQIGQLGNNLKFAPSNLTHHFFIIEPTNGIPSLYIDYAKGDQDSISKFYDQRTFGELVVQERIIKNEK